MCRDFINLGAIGASGTYSEAPGSCNWNYLKNIYVSTCCWWIGPGQKITFRWKIGTAPSRRCRHWYLTYLFCRNLHPKCQFSEVHLPLHARHNSQPCAFPFHCCGSLEDLLSGFPSARRGWGVLSTKTSKPCRGGDNMPIFSSFLCLEAQWWTGDCPEYDWKLKSCIPFCPAVC